MIGLSPSLVSGIVQFQGGEFYLKKKTNALGQIESIKDKTLIVIPFKDDISYFLFLSPDKNLTLFFSQWLLVLKFLLLLTDGFFDREWRMCIDFPSKCCSLNEKKMPTLFYGPLSERNEQKVMEDRQKIVP